MPRPIPPPPPGGPLAAAIGVALLAMDERDLFASSANPETWTLDILRRRQNRTLTRAQAIHLQQYVMNVLKITTPAERWAILAATDALGFVDTSHLTRTCLAGLLQHSRALHQNITTGVIRDQATLRARVLARQTQLLAVCPAEGPAFRHYLDRVADALSQLLP